MKMPRAARPTGQGRWTDTATGDSPNMKKVRHYDDGPEKGVLRPPDSLAHRTPVCKPLAISAGDRGGSLAIFKIFDNRSCHT
jgi:hypothetical protein